MSPIRLAFAAAAVLSQPAWSQVVTGEEPLLGAEVKPQGIDFQVASGGCTSKANFGLETLDRSPLTVRLVRIRPDYCDAHLPDGTRVNFTFAEIGAAPTLSETARKELVIVNHKK